MPRRAEMKMKSMRRTRRALMLAILFTRDFTRLPMDDQYLGVILVILIFLCLQKVNVKDIKCIKVLLHTNTILKAQ